MSAPAVPDEAEREERPPAFVEDPGMAVGGGPRPILLLEGDNHDALRWLRRWRAERAMVNTQLENRRALGLYERSGFRREASGLSVLALDL